VHVLVVDDHSPTRQLVQRGLEQASHGVTTAASCQEAEDAILSKAFDVVVLDVMLPDGSGIDLCRRLRSAKRCVPILLLTARGDVRDRVAGLEAGADDYLTKPFAISELSARVKALGRRGPIYRSGAVSFGSVVIDFEARRVSMSGREVPLTAKELAIVEVLVWRQNSVVRREQLIESVWGDVSDAAAASLDVLLTRIRRKLGPSASLLQTVRGVGYTFRCDP
jgi:two-component system, OmpR family, response regulator